LRAAPREAYVLYTKAKHRSVFDEAELLEPLPRSAWTRAVDSTIAPWPLAF